MIANVGLLVRLITLLDRVPLPPPPVRRAPGKPRFYSDHLILKALVVMIIRRLYTAWALLHFLEQDDPVAQHVRVVLNR